MFVLFRAAIAAAALSLACGSALAATVDLAPATVDLLDVLLPIALGAIPVAMAIVVPAARKLLHVNIEAKMEARLDNGPARGIGWAFSVAAQHVAEHGLTVDIRSQIIASAASYAAETIPSVLKHFKISDPAEVAKRIEARFDQHPAIVAAPAPAAAAPAAA